MGKKKKDAERKKAQLLKQEKKLLKANKKRIKREGITEDIYELLKTYDPKHSTNVECGRFISCDQPSPRAMATLTCLPSGEILLFGGEFYDGATVKVYNDTYKWNVERNDWRHLEATPTPKPRCSHQAVLYNDYVYVFGGEFSTTNQFYHFRDLWRFNIKTNIWEDVHCTGIGPSARSGHRMVVYKNQLIVFGGFHDTFRETRYFNDLHVLCLQTLKWTRLTFPSGAHIPSPRSGMIMVPYLRGNGIYVIGGYCKIKETQKGAKGKCFNDAWCINMIQLNISLKSNTSMLNIWEKLERKAAIPFLRSGMSAVPHKSLALCFGGVTDEDHGGTSLKSIFYNDIQAFDMERRRWFTIDVRKDKKNKQSARSRKETRPEEFSAENSIQPQKCVDTVLDESSSDATFYSEDKYDDETFFMYIDVDGKLTRIKMDFSKPNNMHSESSQQNTLESTIEIQHPNDSKDEDVIVVSNKIKPSDTAKEEGEEEKKKDDNLSLVEDLRRPLPRFSPMLALKNHEFIVYGGLIELRDAELTLDDCWSFNINTRAQWTCILPGHLDEHPWHEKQDTNSDSSIDHSSRSSDTSSTSSSNNSNSESYDNSIFEDSDFCGRDFKDMVLVNSLATKKSNVRCETKQKRHSDLIGKSFREKIQIIQNKMSTLKHNSHTPEANESLSNFLKRSKEYWLQVVAADQIEHVDNKTLRHKAFCVASEHYAKTISLIRKLQRYELAQEENERMN